MKYQSQKIALVYFAVAMALFTVQVSLGLIMGWIGYVPNRPQTAETLHGIVLLYGGGPLLLFAASVAVMLADSSSAGMTIDRRIRFARAARGADHVALRRHHLEAEHRVRAIHLVGREADFVAHLQGFEPAGVAHAVAHLGHGRHVQVFDLAVAQGDFLAVSVHAANFAFCPDWGCADGRA